MNKVEKDLAEEFVLSEFWILSAKWQEISLLILDLKKHLKEAEINKSIKLCIVRNKVKKWLEKILWANILEWIKWFELVQIMKDKEKVIWNYNKIFKKIIMLIEQLIQTNFSNWRGFFEELCNIINEKIDTHFWQENKKLRIFWEELKKQINWIIMWRFEHSLVLRQMKTTQGMIKKLIQPSQPFISRRKTEEKQKKILLKKKIIWRIIWNRWYTNMTY